MKSKEEIVSDWLPRYTGVPLNEFGEYILLTNFINYVRMFADRFGVEIKGLDKPMQTATANNITIINFGMGSAMAATVMDLIGELVHSQGIAAVVATHDPLLIDRADRVIELHDGRIVN